MQTEEYEILATFLGEMNQFQVFTLSLPGIIEMSLNLAGKIAIFLKKGGVRVSGIRNMIYR